MFLYKWRAKFAKSKIFIKLSKNIIKGLKVDCNLMVLRNQNQIFLIFEVILLAVEDKDCQTKIATPQNLVFVNGKNVDILQQNNPKHPKCN